MNMYQIKRAFWVIFLSVISFFLTSCIKNDETLKPQGFFSEQINDIKELGSYRLETNLSVDSLYEKPHTIIRSTVHFDDPVLLAYGLGVEDISYRIVNLDETYYYMYKYNDAFVRGDVLTAKYAHSVVFDQPILKLVESVSAEKVVQKDGYYEVILTYEEIIETGSELINYLDVMMENSGYTKSLEDVSDVNFKLNIELSTEVPNQISLIRVDLMDYMTQKYPLTRMSSDYYLEANLSFQFFNSSMVKDFTINDTYIIDDYSNRPNENAYTIVLGQSITTHVDYVYDIDCFKLVLSEPKTLRFEYSGLTFVLNYLRVDQGTKTTELFNGHDYDFEAGTYYYFIQSISNETGSSTFTFKEK